MTTEVKWKLVQSNQYVKHMKRYRHDQAVIKVLHERVKSLRKATEPRRLGDIKVGQLNGAYGTRLSKSVRLLFTVDDDAHEIRLLNIGNHKEVYGHD